MAGIFRNVLNTVKKAGKDTVKQVKRSGQDVADVASSKVGKVLIGVAVGAGTFGVGTAAVIGVAAGAAKRGGGFKEAVRGGAEGAAAGLAGKAVRVAVNQGIGGFRNTMLKPKLTATRVETESVGMPAPVLQRAEDGVMELGKGPESRRKPMLGWNREGVGKKLAATSVAAVEVTKPAELRAGADAPADETPWYARWWLWLLVALLFGGVLYAFVLRKSPRTAS